MITDEIKKFIETGGIAFAASADKAGNPHLSGVKGLIVPDSRHISFSDWFCPQALENLAGNRHIAIAVVDNMTLQGFQLVGEVETITTLGILDGYDPNIATEETPQVLYGLTIRVDVIMAISHGVHTDRPLKIISPVSD